MARLLKGGKMGDPHRVRRLSFKTKASSERKSGGVRTVRVTVPSNSVSAIASKFNAVVVEDEQRGRAILKKRLVSGSHGGSVREAVLKFEGLQCTKTVLVRKNSSSVLEVPQEPSHATEGAKEKPETRPKPSIDRKVKSRYVNKDLKELLGKEKRFSLPKNQLLDHVFSEEAINKSAVLPENREVKTDKIQTELQCAFVTQTEDNESQEIKNGHVNLSESTEDNKHLKAPTARNKSSLHKNMISSNSVEQTLETTTSIKLEVKVSEETSPLQNYHNSRNLENSLLDNNKTNECAKSTAEKEEDLAKKTVIRRSESIWQKKDIRPNSSFLWGVKESEVASPNVTTSEEKFIKNIEMPINMNEKSTEDKENLQSNIVEDEHVENKENVKKLESPVVRTVDKKGYGKINVQPNTSSLYRNILKQTLLGEIKERLEGMEKTESKIRNEPKPTGEEETAGEVEEQREKRADLVDCSEQGYEVIDETYEVVGFENCYDEIASFPRSEAIYDDVAVIHGERIYESIYSLRRGQQDSDSSSELQTNSLYELRPPSQASSGGSGVAGRTSRSDTSDEWVDVELDSSEELKEQIVLLHETPRARPEGWSVKVRRQWSTRSAASRRIVTVSISSASSLYIKYDEKSSFEPGENQTCIHPFPLLTIGLVSFRNIWYSAPKYEIQEVTLFISNKEDSDSSSKHYELVENRDDDSAVCDDFDDSSDSEFSDVNTYKPNIEERLQPEGNQTDRIYGLMKEAGKRMRKTSSSIGKSLRIISRISKTTSAQDIFSSSNNGPGGNGLPRGRWPSFKKKPRQATSTFYLNEENTIKSPPPRPPPPVTDPRRLSLAIRPTSPPPPPPVHLNGDAKGKSVNDTSLYAECGLFEQNHHMDRRNGNTNSWYSDIGLYENNRPFDTASEHGSSQGSDMDLRFADEPLYQFYTERVAKQELSEELSETGYEEIGENRTSQVRPSALDLVSQEMQRTLWCQVPQVIASGILDTLSPEKKRLQEAKFEVVTSEASYYKSLTILEKHFAASPLLKDENILPKVHYKTLFGNVSAVRKCSEAVLAALEKCWQESILLEGLSDVIRDVAEKHFSVYKKYCTNQVAIERTVKSLKKTHQAFADALETLQKSPKCHNLAFYSFVLLPLQRITRMPLLQDAILTKLTPDDPEYESCRLTLATLNKIVHECNEEARKTERMEEMILLSQSITFPPEIRPIPLMSASRWLVRSGDMTHIPPEPKTTFSRKLTAPRNTKLRLFLFTDYLVVTKKKDNIFVVVTYCKRNLVQMSDIEDPIPNRFLIMLTLLKNHEEKTQEMVMCCGGESSRERWISALSPPAPSNPGERLYEDWDCPQVSASHSYLASQPDELQLQSGDVMNVHRKTVDGWYYGERTRDGEKGWFPGNHTVEILSSHVRARNLKQRYRLLALSNNFIQKQQQQQTNKAVS